MTAGPAERSEDIKGFGIATLVLALGPVAGPAFGDGLPLGLVHQSGPQRMSGTRTAAHSAHDTASARNRPKAHDRLRCLPRSVRRLPRDPCRGLVRLPLAG